jgi:hypothetical protein
VLRHYRERGKVVAGYGASATVTTLLHHFQVGTMIDFLVDDNPIRQGTVSPGTNIPVIDPSNLYHERPDLVVILAWRFAHLVLDRHRPFLEQGGKFLVPLPTVRLVASGEVGS